MPSSATVTHGKWLDRQHSHSSVRQRIRGRPRGPFGTAPAVDENLSGSSSGGVAAYHNTRLLEVRKTALQAAHWPRLGTLENPEFSTNSSDDVLY
jgi:hypothetical protein